MINIIEGNLLQAKEDMICHQVNCKGVMGSGVAKALRNKYPDIFVRYKVYCDNMGAQLLGKIQVLAVDDGKKVVNMFAQDAYGWDKQYTNEKAFEMCAIKLFDYAKSKNLSIAMPYKIGCGRGGADWSNIYKILLRESTRRDVDVVLYKI